MFADIHDFDFIFLTETWLNDSTNQDVISIPNYVLFRKDRIARRGGGVIILVKETIKCTDVPIDIALPLTDICAVDIFLNNAILRFICIYRPQAEVALERADISDLVNLLHSLSQNREFFYIAGDINLPDVDWSVNIAPSDGVQDVF